VGDED